MEKQHWTRSIRRRNLSWTISLSGTFLEWVIMGMYYPTTMKMRNGRTEVMADDTVLDVQ
ncbi:hypothetical protein PISMIDRAFT_671969 [Pisolithus microcarpus 441]|uniref:Uncharacterized protein n=1 Tax=Pisolithus microcarpus 441 TaxID=765257 RepID=A0A0D0AD53_9AGAM|nr:hypothetical protein PISMIDRAFT_671969 [Pisolithus microcarpus 441]